MKDFYPNRVVVVQPYLRAGAQVDIRPLYWILSGQNMAEQVGLASLIGAWVVERRPAWVITGNSEFSEGLEQKTNSYHDHLIFKSMRTQVTKRGQVSVPSEVRKKLQIGPDTRLEWVVEGNTARVIPVPSDPVRAFRGSGKKGMVKRLLRDRKLNRQRENAP